jgi:hypothetical protein
MNVYLKAFIFLIVFSLLHFGYEATGWTPLTIFCAVNESLFQHLKMAFWSYLLLVALIEFPLLIKKIAEEKTGKTIAGSGSFWYSRLLSVIILPYIVLIVWYLQPAISSRLKSDWIDLAWAITVTYLSCLLIAFLEKDTERIKYQLSSRYIILLLVFISGLLFVLFTYRPPWIDLFINPETL